MRRAWLVALACLASAAAAADDEQAWKALAGGGHVVLMRHANAPGTGEPQGAKVDDCKTQRNLDDSGRAQARALGESFRAKKIRVERVLSSPWCRCLETARLLDLGNVDVSWSLVSARGQTPPVRAQELKQMISSWRGPGTLVLVSHGFAIEALYGFIPYSAEMLVLKPALNGGSLVGRILPP